MNKIKILHCAETSGAFSGFGNYSRELFKRLSQNDRFELAEMASFSTVNDNKSEFAHKYGWRYYPVAVESNDPRFQEYNSNPENKHGAWRFERVCLDFQPDIVLDVRDPWNMFFEYRSPFRDFYNWVISPTVDSYPQQDDWIEIFKDADAVFTYSDFGLNVLNKQSNNTIKTQQAIYLGVDLDVFKPLDKVSIREKFGIDKDAIIIGTVMRNQIRKLFPQLFETFAKILDKYKSHPNISKLYLYIHTSFPDAGWDIGELLKEYGISNRVFITYICSETGKPFVSLYEGAKTYSTFSNGISGKFPNVVQGVQPNELAEIYNIFDLYIQYASNEGLGIPQIEASACGVPIASINYSAMEDVVRLTNGIPLSYKKNFVLDTNAYRAVPDIDKNVDEIAEYALNVSKENKILAGQKSRQKAEQYFNWDTNAKIWSDFFENMPLKDRNKTWLSPIRIKNESFPPIPNIPSNRQYIEWLCTFIAKKPQLMNKLIGLNSLRKLNEGVAKIGMSMQPVDRNSLYNEFKTFGENFIACEKARFNILESQDYIEFANMWR